MKSKLILKLIGWGISGVLHILNMIPASSTIKDWLNLRRSALTRRTNEQSDRPNILFICPSLGEYESTEPLIAALRSSSNIHLSFFSDSGYRMLKKEAHLWSSLSYTPIDRQAEVQEYLNEIQPDSIVIAHNFMWPQLLRTIIERNIKLYLIEHSIDISKTLKIFWAGLWTDAYQHASLITCSDQETFDYFADQKGVEPVIKTDSLRYLSTLQHSEQNWSDELIEEFCTRRPTLILASIHEEDIRVIQPIYKELIKCYQLLIVPHHIDADNIDSIRSQLEESMLYSVTEELSNDPILIVDHMGILKYLYRYPSLAYIGGGFGRGIHGAQEAVPYNIPILFGPKYKKFAYAKQLMKDGRAHEIRNSNELLSAIKNMHLLVRTNSSTPINRDKLEQDIVYIANAILS